MANTSIFLSSGGFRYCWKRKHIIKNTLVCTQDARSPVLTPVWSHKCTHTHCTQRVLIWRYTLSLAVCIILQMELDSFQTLLQQCSILCSTLLYSGGRDHGDQRPKACKHEWDQSLWMTSTVIMEIKHHSFHFVCLSGPFYSPNPRDLELCLPHL